MVIITKIGIFDILHHYPQLPKVDVFDCPVLREPSKCYPRFRFSAMIIIHHTIVSEDKISQE